MSICGYMEVSCYVIMQHSYNATECYKTSCVLMWLYGNIDCQSLIPPIKITPRFVTSLCGYMEVEKLLVLSAFVFCAFVSLCGYMEMLCYKLQEDSSLLRSRAFIFNPWLYFLALLRFSPLCPYVVIWTHRRNIEI